MSASRWFSVLIVPTLLVVALLTVFGAVATFDLVSASNAGVCARPAVNVSTIHATFDGKRGTVSIRTDSGPTGVDGGLLAILGESRNCSG